AAIVVAGVIVLVVVLTSGSKYNEKRPATTMPAKGFGGDVAGPPQKGPAAPGDALAFNNAISRVTQDLERVGREFGMGMAGNRGNAARLQQLHSKAVADAARIVQEGRALQPPNVHLAQEFHQTFQEYLNAEEKVIREDMGQLVRFLSEGNDLAF